MFGFGNSIPSIFYSFELLYVIYFKLFIYLRIIFITYWIYVAAAIELVEAIAAIIFPAISLTSKYVKNLCLLEDAILFIKLYVLNVVKQ